MTRINQLCKKDKEILRTLASADLLQLARETFEGILNVQRYHSWWWSLGLTWWYIDLRGLENFLCDLVVEPDWVHRTMNLMCDGVLKWLDDLEQKGQLFSNTVTERFGLNCYGCCEAFEPRWKYVSQIPNLRRVSCSPWCDREKAAELLGNKYIASHKLSPTPLASACMNEDEVRKNLRAVLDCAEGIIPELIMKDNHTLGNQPQNAIRWVELAREEIANT